jgi:hypothetical protein
MVLTADLRATAQARLADAQILLANGRFDGAGYICGYAVELMLKARICDTLSWTGYPDTPHEFQNLRSFRTHNLDVLLVLSGRENVIKSPAHFADWSIVAGWNPEARYYPIGAISPADAQVYVDSTQTLLPLL